MIFFMVCKKEKESGEMGEMANIVHVSWVGGWAGYDFINYLYLYLGIFCH